MAVKEPSRRAHRQLAFQALFGQEFLDCTTVNDLKKAFLAVLKLD